MNPRTLILAMLALILLSACVAPISATPPAAPASEYEDNEHDHATGSADQLGEVAFPVSCTPEAQAEFNQGVAYLHSFWFAPATKSFETAADLDPTCSMAYWGKAMSMLGIPWSPESEQTMQDGWQVVEQALAAGAPTPREQAYIDAVAARYRDANIQNWRERTLAYEAAMAQLAQEYPEDNEAQIFYALALIVTAQPSDKEYVNQRKAEAILEPLLATQPDHPGVAHYLIHTYDYPALADGGLVAARRFAAIAPSAPHALHMPAHIFTRLGYWQESVATNQASAEVAKSNLSSDYPPNTGFVDALHAMDYMMYAYLQSAQDDAAQILLEEVGSIEQVDAQNLGSAYALAAIPSRPVLERGQWAEGNTLALHPADFAWERFPQAEAVLVFARGLSAARAGDPEAARDDLARLETLREAMVATNQGYWAEQAGIQIEEVAAWIALAEGNAEEALASMRTAVDLEAATEKHPVTPGPVLPAQELLGEMLLETGDPVAALAAFEASLQVDPNRFRSIYGAAHAAELAGEMELARTHYEQLLVLNAGTDNGRSELAAAQAFLSQ